MCIDLYHDPLGIKLIICANLNIYDEVANHVLEDVVCQFLIFFKKCMVLTWLK